MISADSLLKQIPAFDYQGIEFSQQSFHLFAGLCAVDSKMNVAAMMQSLQQQGQVCTRMGAFKPRTHPDAFQGLGIDCLPYVFELAGKYGIKIIAIEVTHDRQIAQISQSLQAAGQPCGVILQIGTRNAQNFELLYAVGSQTEFPILYKRGFGITLQESLCASEYIAKAGNPRIIFCLRGIKSSLSYPHRNMVDFAHIPAIRRLSTMPICIDPSHSVGTHATSSDHIKDIYHACAQGIISGANMILVDFHPNPPQALVDSQQALHIKELPWFIEDLQIAREAYHQRLQLAQKWQGKVIL